jgi:uncharacterized protein (TIGR00106 family)
MALMQITLIPLGTQTPSVGDYVADVARYLRQHGIAHQVQDMGTVLHGDSAELLRLAAELHRLPFARGVQRVITQITLDERRDLEQAWSICLSCIGIG